MKNEIPIRNEDEITSPFVFDFEFLILIILLILIVWIMITIKSMITKWGSYFIADPYQNKIRRLENLKFGYCDLFGICYLVFGFFLIRQAI
jgi:hypothetical protein